jgi:hypothetical protein
LLLLTCERKLHLFARGGWGWAGHRDIVAAASRDGLQHQRVSHVVNLAGVANFFDADHTECAGSSHPPCPPLPPAARCRTEGAAHEMHAKANRNVCVS